jgi:hypothetical protein
MSWRSIWRKFPGTFLAGIALALMLPPQQGWSETQVYKSTDDKGQVTYGDKPVAGAVSVENLGVTAPDPEIPAEDQQKRIDRMVETTNRLRDDRLQREKAQAEAHQAAVPPPQPYYVPVPEGYGPSVFGYPGYPGYNRNLHRYQDIPFSVDIHGHGKDFRYDASLGRPHPPRRSPGGDSWQPPLPDGARIPYRQPGLLRNPGGR